MKRFFKLFMAVAVVAGVTACTTDVTEDLGVNLNEGPTTLTLSLDDTRTQLGEKADGVYPLTWAENDAISVNGSVSNALAADAAGAATATFTFNNGFGSAPYFIAYPATSTNNQVVFAAEQTHTSNTSFGNNATVMYGYTTDLNSVKLNHLTGVLKIGIVSGTEGPAFIKEVRISTVDRKPIAGAFNATYNAETEKMELTPAEGATEVITYKASDDASIIAPVGTATSENPNYIYVVVPAGTYGELFVTLESADGVMYKTITTDSSKPIKAGTVREFSNNIEFVPTNEAEVFVISNYGDLYEYKEAVEGGSTLNAILVNDVTLPAANDVQLPAWEPINAPAYAAEFNGNGYAIKGLYAPLFDTIAATIKGVHLKDVDITSATTANVGALANTYKGSNISHCSVAGKITISCKTSVENIIGGLVGLTDYIDGDMTLTDCVNNCDITVNLSNEGDKYLRLGGLFGFVRKTTLGAGGTKNTLTMSNLTNNKPVKVTGGGSAGNMYIGGIAASVGGLYVATLTNLHNKADMTVEVDTANPIRLAGIIAEKYNSSGNRFYHFTAENCTNSGNIKATIKTTSTGDSNTTIAGLFGQIYDEEEGNIILKNCDNSGNVEFYGMPTNTDLTVRVDMGGVVGVASGRVNISNCDNTGEKIYTDIGTQAGILTMGGIAGRTAALSSNNVSSASNLVTLNTCTNKANISYYVQTTKKEMFIGGILGSWYGAGSTRFRLTMYSCTNEGNLLASSNVVSGTATRTLMGLIGSSWMNANSTKTNNKTIHKFEIKDCVNGKADGSSTMTITGDSHRHINVGGIMGYCYAHYTIDNCTNNMKYIYDSKSTDVHYYGGLYGRYYQYKHLETTANNSDTNGTVKLWSNIKSFTNNGAADIKVSSENTLCASGIFGITDGANDVYIKLGNVTNSGTLTISNKVADATCKNLYVGGIIADMKNRETSLYDTSAAVITNNGNISVTGVKGSTTNVIGAAIGDLQKDFSNITVDCTLAVDEGVAAGMLAGVASTAAKTFTDCKVGGKFVEGTTETTLDSTNFVKYLFSDRVLTSYAGVTLVE